MSQTQVPHKGFEFRRYYNAYNENTRPKENVMFNKICGWFAKRYIPADTHTDLADALFAWRNK